MKTVIVHAPKYAKRQNFEFRRRGAWVKCKKDNSIYSVV